MKKILFCAGLLATVTSCTQDELMNDSFAEQSKGISFSATVPDALESRGELSYNASTMKFPFFWYAEKDKINIYAKGEVKAGDENMANEEEGTTVVGIITDWTSASPAGAKYKATKSMADGAFTAVNDANLIEFGVDGPDDGTTVDASFVATYGATLASAVPAQTGNGVTKIVIKAGAANSGVDYNQQNIADIAPMYSYTSKSQEKKYNSVGETVGLQFYRPMAVAGFTTSGINAEYKELFGNLEKVTITMLGNKDEELGASGISYTLGADITVDLSAPYDASKTKVVTSGSSVYGTFAQKFGDNDVVYLPLANVSRVDFREAEVNEYYSVEYKFANIDFKVDSLSTSSDWVSNANSILPVPSLDMNNYPYLMVKDGDDYALIVNSGNFSDIYKDADKTLIEWPAVTAGISVEDVTTIISKVDLTDAEQTNLSKFENLVNLTLEAETKIVKGAFTGLTNLKNVNMPLVTEISSEFATTETVFAIDSLKLGSYAFDNADINERLITEVIQVLDISGVSDMKPQYNVDAKLSFQGLTNLEKIKVNNLKLNSNAFNGCTALELVEGVVDITSATSAFYGCTALEEVNISGTVIPAHAFNGCTTLTKVLYNGAQVAPTSVGESAFKNAGLTTMNLADATTIGKNAFNGSALQYASYTNATTNDINMVVGVAVVEEYAFANTALQRVHFKNATEIKNGILAGVTTLKQIKFGKEFTVVETNTAAWDRFTFGGKITTPDNPDTNDVNEEVVTLTNDVEFFVATADQKYQEGTMIKLPYKNGTNTVYSTFSFKTITVE